MARVVVTGGCGFVGSRLVRRLVARGDDVVVFDGASRARNLEGLDAVVVPGDVRDAGRLASVIGPGVDVVYHLAAVVGVDQYLARPLDVIDVNFTGTRNVLDLAVRADARVVVASTSEVFGKNPAVPWSEEADRVLGPTSADRWSYSTSKALAEHLTLAYGRQHGLAATIVRYFNAYGPGQRPAYIVSRSVHRALNGRPLVVYDGGSQTRCFTYVDDVVEGTLRAGADPAAVGETFNLGGTHETTVADVVALIARLAGFDGPIAPVDTARRLSAGYQDLQRRIPDTRKAAALLGWRAVTPLQEGLRRTVDWARDNPWWLALEDSGALSEPAGRPVEAGGGA
ncbi:NAD-dependent epimerase/dehydratase family protein [Streptomyces sp. NPDC006193]|uniref:NAD-dependent epimerase/dehydratase family protein n=1 Tax=Streptomyces sp. NPDC006193 TaxID=3155717 RepID=UPI0033ABFA00